MNQRPRLSVEISEELHLRLMRLIPWGVKSTLFAIIAEEVADLIERHGTIIVAAILDKRLGVQDFGTLKEILNGNNRKSN